MLLIGCNRASFHAVLGPAADPFGHTFRGEVLGYDHVVRGDQRMTTESGTQLPNIARRLPGPFGDLGRVSLYVISGHAVTIPGLRAVPLLLAPMTPAV